MTTLLRSAPVTRNLGFLAFATGAVASAAAVWFALPHEREVSSVWVLLVKLIPVLLATEAIARLDPDLLRRAWLHKIAIPAVFLVFFCWFVPKIFFYSDQFDRLYYLMLTLTPVVILGLVFAYRLGGGAPSQVRRLAVGMLLLMLSGLEDLAFLVVNHGNFPESSRYANIPDVWDWASHMTVFLGHPPTKHEAFAFIAVHVVAALLVFFLPKRYLTGALGWARRLPRTAAYGNARS
ncbi:MAG: hypothetical protein LC798_00950 [Chloroflexi bacterium]|nr:hypothetical protein [Chloroflexota bacterium]